jgi:hypothetical protein
VRDRTTLRRRLGAALNRIERFVERLLGRHDLPLLRGKQHRQRHAQLREAASERLFHQRQASLVRASV